MPQPRAVPRCSDIPSIAAIVLAAVAITAAALLIPPLVGWWEDDGVYLVTGRALAEGHGYRLLHLPGEPWQTKYPPLYPAMLAALWFALGELDSVVRGMQVLQGLSVLGAALACYRLATRWWALERGIAAMAVVLAVVAFATLELISAAMSEHLFACLAAAALLLGTRLTAPRQASSEPEAGARRSDVLAGLALGALVAAAMLTRSIGITLVPAVILGLVIARRWRALFAASASLSIPLISWFVARSAMDRLNARISEAAVLRYDLDYSAWVHSGIGGVLRVAGFNALEMPYAMLDTMGPLPPALVGWAIGGGVLPLATLLVMMAAAVGLIAAGLMIAWRRGGLIVPAFIAFYFGLVLIWPFPPQRFFTPMLPLLMPLLMLGLSRVVGLTASFLHSRALVDDKHGAGRAGEFGRRAGRSAAYALGVIVGLNSLAMVLAVVRTPPAPDERALREGIAAVIRDRLPTNAVVATDYGSYFWLVTGRRVLHPVPPNDPVGLLYPPDRQALRLGIGLSPGHSAAVGALVQREVLDYYRAAGVTHLALRSRQRPREAALQDLALRERGSFRTVAREPLFTMYSFTPR